MKTAFLALFLVAFTQDAWAKVSTSVTPSHPAYDVIDRLEARRCAYATYRGMAPQSYADLRAAVDVGEAPPDDEENPEAHCDLPRWLRKERDILLRGQPAEVTATALLLKDDEIALPRIDARVTPSYALREGRPFFNGPNLDLSFTVSGSAGRNDVGLAFGVTPAFVAGLREYDYVNGRFYLHEGYVKLAYKWAELGFGRVARRFGQTAHGSLLLSGAAKPLSAVELRVRPHLLGKPFGFLGPFTFDTWVSDTDEGSGIADARLWGVALGMRPATWLELTVMELYQLGGTGVPSVSLGDVFKMLFYGGGSDLEAKRQRALGLGLAFWGPENVFKLYVQAYFDSLSSPSDWFSDEVSPLVGLWFPRLGNAELRLELVHTVQGAYRHAKWTQGLTYKGTTLGHPIGPDADGAYLDIGFPPVADFRPAIGVSYEARLKHPLAGQATDTRYGLSLELRKRWVRTELALIGRYTHVLNDHYVPQADNDLGAAYASLKYAFF